MPSNADLSSLNESQLKVVNHGKGRCVVQASAGSGKTTALIHRTVRLVNEGVKPESILLTTFSKQAAEEIKKRINAKLPEHKVKGLKMGTMHSMGYRYLMRYRSNDFKKVIVGLDPYQLVKTAARSLGIYGKLDAKPVLDQLNFCKNCVIERELWKQTYMEKGFENKNYEIGQEYERMKWEKKYIDFSDMLYCFYELLQSSPKIKTTIQEEIEYLMIDEYQDQSSLQLALSEIIGQRTGNILMVGDVRQSIYGFIGARPDLFVHWTKDGSVTKINFNKNYRSATCIIKTANSLIRHNTIGADNDMDEDLDVEGKITAVKFVTNREEARTVSHIIKLTRDTHKTPLNEFAVIYRTNAQAQVFEDQLSQMQIPYQVVGGDSFFNRMEIQDVLAYLKLSYDPHDDLAFERIVNKPYRNLGETWLAQLQKNAQGSLYTGLSIFNNRAQANQAKHLKQTIDSLISFSKGRKVSEVLEFILKLRSPWAKGQTLAQYWDSDKNKDKENSLREGSSKTENVQSLAEMAETFDSCAKFVLYIQTLVSNFQENQAKADKVSLLTSHKAKGKEYEVVFVVGLNEELFPHKRALEEENKYASANTRHMMGVEEERRLCYVAVTRAKRTLNLSTFQQGNKKAYQPSRFFAEMNIPYFPFLTTVGSSTKPILDKSPPRPSSSPSIEDVQRGAVVPKKDFPANRHLSILRKSQPNS